MRFLSLPLSLILHLGAVAIFVFAAFNARGPETRYVPPIPVDIISEAELAELTSVPEMTRTEEPEFEEPAAEEVPEVVETEPEPVAPDPEPEPEPEPAAPDPEPEPAPVEEEPVVEEAPAEEEPEPEAQPEVEEPVEEEDDLSDLAGLIDRDPDKERNRPSVVNPDAASGDRDQERVGEGTELTVDEQRIVKACLKGNYRLDRGARDWEQFIVVVDVRLNLDTTLAGPVTVKNMGEITRTGNASYQAAARNAVAAVNSCFPMDGLDPGNYSNWAHFEFTFRPTEF